ncbi:tetratricopeptide repeat protein [Chryseobacterium luquanense]|uniref:Tetratricopeptide repeat protein n=1 Tax=Chryseobacterium luquanense TaxID=2983766 RepID=A0ABT3Y211_9FLAO|nr:tetratricopeptide repeat protein [Chryseobacterium luquanense]MCX8532160.1 hypothetical protein [Chryseobacterium luquanense]
MNRKEFLSLSSLGIFSFMFPSFKLFSNTSKAIVDVNVLLKNACILRKQKKFNQAKQAYEQIIAQHPDEIRAYDGLRKTFLSQKKKEWQVILMFKTALLLNPNNPELKKRLYKEYFNACLGNKKVKNLINFNGRLLSHVLQNFATFVQNHPNNLDLQKQYSRITRLLDCNADTQNAKQNQALKAYNKQQYKNFKNRFSELNTSQLESKLAQLSSKPISLDRKQHIRELHKLIFQKLRKEKNNTEALNKALSYYNTIDKKDPLFLKYVRDLSKFQKKYDILISVEAQNHTLKNNFWSALALLDAHVKKAEHQNISVSGVNATSLFLFLEENMDSPDKKFEVATRKIKFDLINNQTDLAKEKILNQCKIMYGVSNTHSIDRMNILIAKYFKRKGDVENKNKILNIVGDPKSFIESSDPIIVSTALINQNRSSIKPVHLQNLQNLISKL